MLRNETYSSAKSTPNCGYGRRMGPEEEDVGDFNQGLGFVHHLFGTENSQVVSLMNTELIRRIVKGDWTVEAPDE